MKYNFDERGIAPKVREALEYLDGKTPEDGIKQGAAVANAAGAAPTAAEYNALLGSLRTAGIIATE
ncbi:hypothetical protein [Lacrimispora sp.]|jgi:hypothetical protein|uniref:hypothetical protein n=1 Tax=Lacrimispora sp. TaxID=2719234 RepID=UPI00289BA675|nr:hypothetical protein [Lacrimispora sp.]